MAEQVPAILEGQDMSFLEMQGDEIATPVEEEDPNPTQTMGIQQLDSIMFGVLSRFEGGLEEVKQLIEEDKEDIKEFKKNKSKFANIEGELETEQGQENDLTSFVAASVPGSSLTGDLQDNEKGTLGKFPWETPPDLSSPIEAFDYIIERKNQDVSKENAIKLLYAGVPAEAIARTITFRGFLSGLWTPDISELLVIPLMLDYVADAQEEGIRAKIFNDFNDDSVSDESVLTIMEDLNPEELTNIKQHVDTMERMPMTMMEEEEPVIGSFLDMEGEENG